MTTENQNLENTGPSDEQITQARELGWADKDEWRGDPDDWVDAATFLERGTTVLPMLQKNLKRTMDTNAQLSARVSQTEMQLRAANAALAALDEERTADAVEDLKEKKADIKARIVDASKNGDHEAVADLQEQLAEIVAEEKAAASRPKPNGTTNGQPQVNPQLQAELVAWRGQNADFMANPRKVALGQAVAAELRSDPKNAGLVGAAFMDKVREEVEKSLGGSGAPGHSRVSAGAGGKRDGGGSGGGGGGGKTYADLPKEARDACDRMEARVVGAGKKHKDQASWRKSYTAQYFKGEQ